MSFFQLRNISVFFILSFMISMSLMSSEEDSNKQNKDNNSISEKVADAIEREVTSTPLLLQAVREGELDIVKDLLKGTADPNEKDANGWTPLMEAIINENLDMVLILLKYKAYLNIKDNIGNTPLTLALNKIYETRETFDEELQDVGFWKDLEDQGKETKKLLKFFTFDALNQDVLMIAVALISYSPCQRVLLDKPSNYKAKIETGEVQELEKNYKL